MALWLQKLGAHVVGYSLMPPTEPNLFELACIHAGMTSILGDIRDLRFLIQTLTDHKPEIVIHLAAQSLVRYSYNDPVETFSTNVMGTVNVLEAIRSTDSIRAVILVTSDKCYENREWSRLYKEDESLGGRDPYSSSKACSELVAAAYRSSFFGSDSEQDCDVAVATARAGNVIGGGDWAQDRILPDCFRAFSAESPVLLRYPHAVRPWQHVFEPLCGYLMLAEHLMGQEKKAFSEAWNFGPNQGDDATVFEIAQMAGDFWGNGRIALLEQVKIPPEASILRLDISKAVDRLGWRPRWGLNRALKETVAWFKAWHKGEEMRHYSLTQISIYESEA